MKTCPTCGHENNEDDRFCANCGARLTRTTPEPATPSQTDPEPETNVPDTTEEKPRSSPIPPAVTPSFAQSGNEWARDREPADDEWKMSDLGPPPNRKRPLWLWIIISIFVAILLCCILGFAFFNFTDAGQQIWDDAMATAEAMSTEQAGD